jgi:hypothetical protein
MSTYIYMYVETEEVAFFHTYLHFQELGLLMSSGGQVHRLDHKIVHILLKDSGQNTRGAGGPRQPVYLQRHLCQI